MRLHLTALVLCRFAGGFSPSEGLSRARGFSRQLGVRTSTYPATVSTIASNGGRSTSRSTSPTSASRKDRGSTKMVLRPDWERDGKVLGFKPLRRKEERAFEYLVEYPCNFQIKVIGLNEGSFAADIAATVSAACEVETEDVRFTVRYTSSGKYQSITLHAPVKSASMLYRCYERIDEASELPQEVIPHVAFTSAGNGVVSSWLAIARGGEENEGSAFACCCMHGTPMLEDP